MFFQILKLNHLTLAFFVTSKFEMLGTFDGDLHTAFALGALQPEDQLLGSFCLKHKLDSLDSLKKALIFTWNQFWWKMNFVFNGIVIHNVEIWQLFYAPFRLYVKAIQVTLKAHCSKYAILTALSPLNSDFNEFLIFFLFAELQCTIYQNWFHDKSEEWNIWNFAFRKLFEHFKINFASHV